MPWRGICVQASGEFGGTWGFAWTGSDGTYTVSGLAAGDYPVEFWDCNEPAFYASEYYNDMTSWSAATLVTVTAGVDSPGIDAALSLKTGFSGRIYDERTGLALRDGHFTPKVTAHSTSGLGRFDDWVGWEGHYTVETPPGTFRLDAQWGGSGFIDYPDRVDLFRLDHPCGTAPPLTVAEHQIVTNVDFVLRSFCDVGSGSWFFESVEAIAAAGITDGYPDRSYRPGNTLAR